MALHAHDIL